MTACRLHFAIQKWAYLTPVWQYTRVTSVIIGCCLLSPNQQVKAQKCQIFLKTFYATIFVVKSISFQLLPRLMCCDTRLYSVSILQNISVSLSVLLNQNMSISVNEYNTGLTAMMSNHPVSYRITMHTQW